MPDPNEEYSAALPVAPAQPVQYVPQPGYVQPAPQMMAYAPQQMVDPSQLPESGSPLHGPEVQETKTGPELVLVSHSMLFYWWPVWVIGYLMALFTWTNGQNFEIAETVLRVHPSNNPGILFFLTVFLVIVITNVEVRGLASALVIMFGVLVAVTLAYMRWWDDVFGFFGNLNVYLNQGAYFWFSTLVFIVWAVSTFVTDRMSYWVVKPGQVTREYVWGSSSESYDTENMTLEKRRDDLFRHWLLGLGTGDLRIHTYGAKQEEIFIPNVLFMGARIKALEKMIAMEPGEFGRATVK